MNQQKSQFSSDHIYQVNTSLRNFLRDTPAIDNSIGAELLDLLDQTVWLITLGQLAQTQADKVDLSQQAKSAIAKILVLMKLLCRVGRISPQVLRFYERNLAMITIELPLSP